MQDGFKKAIYAALENQAGIIFSSAACTAQPLEVYLR